MRFASVLLLGAVSLHAAVWFEPNRGQSGAGIDFVARTGSGTAGVGGSGILVARRDGERARIELRGARRGARGTAEERAVGVSHYAVGSDPSRWIWDVPRYRRVRYAGVYPGIDAAYHEGGGGVEFDFLVAAGADPALVELAFSEPVRVTEVGDVEGRTVTLRRPSAWQDVDGRRVAVDVAFAAEGKQRMRFCVGRYDRSRALTIDPIVMTASFLGGSDNEADSRVTVGSDGAIYLAGTTASADFPAALPAGSLLNRPEILLAPDAYVTRIRADGSAQDWSLFVGGTAAEAALGLRHDSLGNVYLLGSTSSPNFPVTAGAYQTGIHPSLQDLFLVKLDAQTGHIKATTFLGVPTSRAVLAVDASGGIYVAGLESDPSFKTTPGAYQAGPGSSVSEYGHTFILRLNAAMTGLVYATLFDPMTVAAIDVDANGNAVLGGNLASFPYPGSPTFQAVNPIPGVDQTAGGQAFVAKMNAMGTALVFATEVHGNDPSASSVVSDVLVDADGGIHVLGNATALNFPQVKPVAYSTAGTSTGITGGPFWMKLPATGGSPIQSTLFVSQEFLAPSGTPLTALLALPPGGQPCFLNVGGPQLQQSPGGLVGRASDFDYYQFGGTLVCVNAGATGLGVKTMLPPGATYSAAAAAPDGSLVLAGTSQSNFTTTPGAFQTQFGGGAQHDQFYAYSLAYGDGFLMRLSLDNPAPQIQAAVPEAMVLIGGNSGTAAIDVYGTGFAAGIGATLNGRAVKAGFVNAGHVGLSSIDYSTIQAGPNPIALSLPGPGGGTSQATLTGIYPTPSGVSVSPASANQGAPDTKLVIRATGLVAQSSLYWNGQPRSAQWVVDTPAEAGHLELILGAVELAAPFAAQVAVGNPSPGGGMSASIVFAVQPNSGSAVPALRSISNPVVFGGSVALGPKIAMTGSGFTSSTRAFWDGVEVPVDVVSATSISLAPPAADLTRWGGHDVYVVNGTYRSATVRQFVARAVNAANAAVSDPVHQRLYVLVGTPYQASSPSDLQILDLRTGALLATVSWIAPQVQTAVLSTDGQYLYLAGNPSSPQITRYNTVSGAVDLQWSLGVAYEAPTLLPVPGSPESVIVWTTSLGVTIYDRGQPRLTNAIAEGFQASDAPVFSTSSRIYLSPANGSCWRWMTFDPSGISGGSFSCAVDPGSDAVHDGGFVYLTDGQRAYLVTAPANLGSGQQTSFLVDLPRRRVIMGSNYSGVVEYNLDSRQQTLDSAIGATPIPGGGVDVTFLVLGSGWIAELP